MDWIMDVLFSMFIVALVFWIISRLSKDDDQQGKAAPQPAAVAIFASSHDCPYCQREYADWGVKLYGDAWIGCKFCARHFFVDGKTAGRDQRFLHILTQEADDCRRVAAGEYDSTITEIVNRACKNRLDDKLNFTISHDSIWVETHKYDEPYPHSDKLSAHHLPQTTAGLVELANVCCKKTERSYRPPLLFINHVNPVRDSVLLTYLHWH